MNLDPYRTTHRTLGIVDTNAILSSVRNDCRHGWDSRLLRSTLFDCTILYAADHVFSEVYEHLPKVAAKSGVSVEELQARFELKYIPALRFVTVSSPEKIDARVLTITDVDDHPTGQLALLIAPVIVYSEDKHLTRPGFAPPDWRTAARYTASVAEAAGQERAAGMALALPVAGVWASASALSRRLCVPPWQTAAAVMGLLSMGGYRLLQDPSRRARMKNMVVELGQGLLSILAEQRQLRSGALSQ